MSRSSDVQLVLDCRAELGEGPVWDHERRVLIWVDITNCAVHIYDPATGHDEQLDVGRHVGAAAVRTAGGFVLAVVEGFATVDTDTREVRIIAPVEGDKPGNRMNDGKCDSSGRFWAGTVPYDPKPEAGALYRLDRDRSVSEVLTRVSVSNGLGWSPDDRTMYYIDSFAYAVDAFDYEPESGTIHRRRRLVQIDADEGMPDGMSVDSEGFVWVALWGTGRIHRYSPTGSLEDVVELPITQVTSCTFGGNDLDDLYITSASYGLSENERQAQPQAGGLFRTKPGVTGLKAYSYEG